MGTAFTINAELSIGRESTNSICLTEASISRRHCVIKRVQGSFKIADLDSFNGTFVNGIPVKEQTLAHGDQIGVGRVLFLFLVYETRDATENAVQLDDLQLTDQAIQPGGVFAAHRQDFALPIGGAR